jgi:hypothetical protein
MFGRKRRPVEYVRVPPGAGQLRSRSRVESIAKTPWIEAATSAVIGAALLALGKPDLGELTWILGVALSFTRYAFSQKLEDEMAATRNLTAVVDLQRELRVGQFQELLRIYLEITEPEFYRVKDTIVTEAISRLTKLAHEKTSGELATGEYFNWLFPELQSTSSGSEIWAISMMLNIEWLESQVEQTFLDLNLDAAKRRVYVERIFVAHRAEVPRLLENPYIRAQYDSAGEYLNPMVVEREYLESHDPTLLRRLGDGLIGVDDRVVLVDISSPEGYRGYVTMNAGDIANLRRMYDNLRVNARRMRDVIPALPARSSDGGV